MPHARLTKSTVEKLSPGIREIVVWDEALPGFGVRVKPTGMRSFVVQYRNRTTGQSKRMTLGRLGPLMTFDQAKKQARAILADVSRGDDPVGQRKDARLAPKVADLCTDYLDRHAIPNKRPKSVRDDQRMIDGVILPAFGSASVTEVTRRDIEALHLRYADRPYQGNRLLALLSRMFNLAIDWDWRSDNPVKGVRRFAEEKRDRWLSDDELARLWDALVRHPNRRAACAVQLQIVTGARLGEVLSARIEDFDPGRGVWTKPSHQTKQRRREHVPLSQIALDLLEKIIDGRSKGWLFPGEAQGDHLKDIKKFWAALMTEVGIENYRRHDNRHTFASHLVSNGLSLEVVGRLLGHTQAATTMRYAHIADDPLRRATTIFSDKISKRNT